MCKVMEDMRRETAIMAVIDTCRDLKLSEDDIRKRIMIKFNLTKTEAQAYLDLNTVSAV